MSLKNKKKMWSIKIFGRCIVSRYCHRLMKININNLTVEPTLLQAQLVTKNNISLLNGGYFNVKNLLSIMNNSKNRICGFLYWCGRDVIGYAFLALRGGAEFHYKIKNCDAFLFDFCVLNNFRNKGFGKMILNHIFSYLKEKRLTELCLAVKENNLKAIKLYEQIGFRTVKYLSFIRIFKKDFPSLIC